MSVSSSDFSGVSHTHEAWGWEVWVFSVVLSRMVCLDNLGQVTLYFLSHPPVGNQKHVVLDVAEVLH